MDHDQFGVKREATSDTKALLEQWLGFGAAVEDNPELRRVLFDSVTGLPTTPLLFPRISSLLEDRGEVSLLCVNVIRYSHIEEVYGWRAFDDIMRHAADALDEIAGETLRDADVVAEIMNSGNAFIVVLSPPRTTDCIEASARKMLACRVEERLNAKLADLVDPAVFSKVSCYTGSSTIHRREDARIEQLVYEGLEVALADSRSRADSGRPERIERLRSVIEADDVTALLQPIFNLQTMDVIGYQALARGPEASEYEYPDKLFTVAYDTELVTRLEQLCRNRALESAALVPEGRLLFLKIEPRAIGDPRLREFASAPGADAIDASRVVLEITERRAIGDFVSFRATLDLLRAFGFSVAVDDAGAGYGSLQCLADVRPDWLKVDMSLVRGCDTDDVRYSLVESLKRFADAAGSKLVAEGIETEAELQALRKMGVVFGQGSLLAQPGATIVADKDLPAQRFIG